MDLLTTTFLVSGILTALLAGVYFAYSVSIIGALRMLKDVEYVRTMQAINKVIQNPLFFLTLMGPLVSLPVLCFLVRGTGLQFTLVLAATIAFYVSFGITAGANVPLNERLTRADASSQGAETRAYFEKPWNKYHNVRTLISIASLALLFWAALL